MRASSPIAIPALAGLLLLSLLPPLPAGDDAGKIIEFRGRDGSGHAKARDLPRKFDEKLNVVWRTPLPGRGYSTPVIENGPVLQRLGFSSRIW